MDISPLPDATKAYPYQVTVYVANTLRLVSTPATPPS